MCLQFFSNDSRVIRHLTLKVHSTQAASRLREPWLMTRGPNMATLPRIVRPNAACRLASNRATKGNGWVD
jgi:hypothetical protein